MESTPLPTGIILAATPLGNIGDATPRLRQALADADYIAAEDTRRTRQLAAALGVEIRGQIVSNFDHNEQARVTQLLEYARTGTVVVVTDAGMPIVSDPGFPLIAAAHDHNIPVTCFPGPSAVPVALALSGLHVGKFAFDGFAPRKPGARKAWLETLRTEQRAVCFFESPHRIAETLADAAAVLGDQRRAAVARELTKTYEEVKRGTLAELAQWAAEGLRGEISVVIEGVGEPESVDLAGVITQALDRVEAGERLKSVCAELASVYNVSKKELYDGVLAARAKVNNHE
ncbi:16S rRNA (cytidine(1402)-2'-O)-methyltransferase [Corynebacterium sp. HS2168-gen11]|uniref:16S rRNA (cytidine(1402)-2'-O)-methyltransferase n=1 Tax=Corynebacterium sp. HS2168-gen11 TaxID=2974027 RepID=UPI00216B2C89|nr:16S rRNA (cytidine(1402)-2'-O)-methyltransferase [Corynebacterium sp. HS2168-gen11]MCS4536379.1 16S rRNA (cytidine(1402)-2'-O)-methyltransferase [Corynebacterium sp. HS2168-gen11]